MGDLDDMMANTGNMADMAHMAEMGPNQLTFPRSIGPRMT